MSSFRNLQTGEIVHLIFWCPNYAVIADDAAGRVNQRTVNAAMRGVWVEVEVEEHPVFAALSPEARQHVATVPTSYRRRPDADPHGNVARIEGMDRCPCGCKYWENDRCVDCGGTEVLP